MATKRRAAKSWPLGAGPAVNSPRLGLHCLLFVLCFAAAGSAPTIAGGPFDPPPLTNVQGEVVNFETPLIKPLIVTADGQYLVALNEPDNRVVVRRTSDLSLVAEIVVGQGLTAVAERPGSQEIWVSAMHSSGVMVIDTATWRVTHVLRPTHAEAGLGEAAAPGAIAFSADGAKAWVVATVADALLVYDAATKVHLKTVPLAVVHNGRSTRLKEPRSLLRHNDWLYVAIHRSGNQTAAGPVDLFGLHPEIIDLTRLPGLSLPDADILALSTIDESVLFSQKGVGTLLYGLAVNSTSGEIIAASMNALNGLYIGERSGPEGRLVMNRLTYLAPGSGPSEYNHVALEDLPTPGGPVSLAMPTDVVVDSTGRVFVAGYAARAIGVFDSAGGLLGVLASEDGPRGLALSPAGDRLYSLNRIAGTITAYDVDGQLPEEPFDSTPIGRHDPTFDRVVEGRAIYNDAVKTSGGGSNGCFSCHPDLASDGVAWDLSAYHDDADGFTVDNPPEFWRDRKQSMTTQDCRSLEDSAPYHWRGEQKDLEDFNAAIGNLQKAPLLPADEMTLIKDYVFSAVYAANPDQPFDRVFSAEALAGSNTFQHEHWTDTESVCNDCHTLPLGSRGAINGRLVVGEVTAADHKLKGSSSPQMRGLWTKHSDHANVRETGSEMLVPVTGFGVNHTGSHRDVAHYVRRQFKGFSDPQLSESIISFLTEFDSGLAPMSNFSYRLDQATATGFDATFYVDQTMALNCDLAARGRLRIDGNWRDVGLFFDRALQAFVSDDSGEAPISLDAVVSMAEAGQAELLILGVPVWSGERIGVDRDRDGLYDRDELAAGADPTRPDSDGDGFWDSIDDDPLNPAITTDDTTAPSVFNVDVQYTTASAIRVLYETSTFSPTRVVYGRTDSYGQEVGEPVPLPAGSNHWKRHHSIVLRKLDDGVTYHFQIRTVGQNGVAGATADLTADTLTDSVPLNPETMHVDSLSVDASANGQQSSATAFVRIVNNRHEPVPDAKIHGMWTVFLNGEPMAQMPGNSGLTDADGNAVVETTFNVAVEGMEIDFTVPMYRGPLGQDLPGVLDTVLENRRFAWSDNVKSSVRVVIP